MFGSAWGARAHHLAWPLHSASLDRYDDQLIRASGLSDPVGDPIVQYSPGVDVRVGVPYRVRRSVADTDTTTGDGEVQR